MYVVLKKQINKQTNNNNNNNNNTGYGYVQGWKATNLDLVFELWFQIIQKPQLL